MGLGDTGRGNDLVAFHTLHPLSPNADSAPQLEIVVR
jgi:hypothetical protein